MKAIVTGSTGVFGRHICAGLVAAGVQTVCVCRDKVKGEALLEFLAKVNSSAPKPSIALVDCASQSALKQFAASQIGSWPIDILVANAAVTPTTRKETSEGIEMQWATNVLQYHWLLRELQPALDKSTRNGGARVHFVASFNASGLNLDDPEFKTRDYNSKSAYSASKQANRILAAAWANKLEAAGSKIIVTSGHPGRSTSSVSLGIGLDVDRSEKSQVDGAKTALHCVLDDGIVNGAYYVNSMVEPCPLATNEACEKLLRVVDSY